MIRIAIIEDTKNISDILEVFFSEEKDFKVEMVVGSGEEFLKEPKCETLDAVLCDIGLPGKSGMETTWLIKEKYPHLHVIMFTVFEDEEKIFKSLQAGASGYLLKNTPLLKLKQGVLEVLNGGAAMSPKIAKKVIDHFNLSVSSKKSVSKDLSEREIEVVSLINKGLTNKEIGESLFISVDTVKYHIKNIYSKLHVNSRVELLNLYSKPFKI